jgi:hypothetical protein
MKFCLWVLCEIHQFHQKLSQGRREGVVRYGSIEKIELLGCDAEIPF